MRKRVEITSDQAALLPQIEDSQLRILKDSFGVRLHRRRNQVTLQGETEQIEMCEKAIKSIIDGLDRGKTFDDSTVKKVCQFHLNEPEAAPVTKSEKVSFIVEHKTPGQEVYLKTMQNSIVTFASGPAGSGKTFLAVGMAVHYLQTGRVNRIVLVRPAVEAGEKLGFLPGDLNDKIKPYLLPLFDALRYFLGNTRAEQFAEKNVIEVAPLAYMRGRTLDDCFMILDEAQNTTIEQMKMFLTRIGQNSRAVITGDTSQIDLGKGEKSGMVHAKQVLSNVERVSFVNLKISDIVRHPVVGAIVKAYEKFGSHK